MRKLLAAAVSFAAISMGRRRSCIGRRHGREGETRGTASGDLRLERLLHWCQRWLGTEPQLLGFR